MGNFVGSEPQKDDIELRIYEIVEKRYPEYCEKITGMLLEVDQTELKELLENHQELNDRIDRAAAMVGKPTSRLPAHDIGNKVFGTVQQLYPAFARQVTGMLLELGEERLIELLACKDHFIAHIHKAAAVVMDTEVNKKASRYNIKGTVKEIRDNNTSKAVSEEEEQEKEQLACQIYLKVVNQYPKQAEKITGMLLEMNTEDLREVNNDDGKLMERVSQAVQALRKEENCCETDNNRKSSKQQDRGLLRRLMKSELNLSTLEKQLVGLDENMQKELIGEEVYKILFNMYPNDCDIITGMLLEMDITNLLETLANPDLLQNRVEQALEALDKMR